jgi:protein-S-isoprenylcysteine O-methyltransferase Ste14
MSILEGVRYFLGLWMTAFLPPAVLFWIVVHPLIGFWRRVGVARTYWILIPPMLIMAGAVFYLRDPVMAVDLGLAWPLAIPGLGLFAVGVWIDKLAKDHLKFRVLAGVPELQSAGDRGRLLRDGIYGRVRHPRYLGISVSVVGTALMTNYLVVYLTAAFTLAALYAVAVLEERELVDRFGDEYRRYQAAVPRFIPRLRSERQGA